MSPEDSWYDQGQHAWVVVVKGAAKLRFDGDDEPLEMNPAISSTSRLTNDSGSNGQRRMNR